MKFSFENTNKIKIKSFYRKTIDKDFNMSPHSHDYVEIMNILSGAIYLDIYQDGKLFQTQKVSSNSLILIASNCYHKIRTIEPVLIQNLEFETTYQEGTTYLDIIGFLKNSFEWRKISFDKKGTIIIPDYNEVSQTISHIINRIQAVGIVNNDIYLDSLVFILFVKICEFFKNKYVVNGSITYHTKKAIDIIQQNLNNDISVKEVADSLDISVSYLERIFKESTNMTVKKFIHLLKIDHVRDDLVNTNISIESIVSKYAYENIAQLNYQFKKVYNQTPLSYRRDFYKKEIHGTDEKYESITLN
ncbi:MAG: AraC family transcriptional regulator [Candidatus Enteromonas sp.]|nr:AraC family transcriptional regulator [Candidatus Enteromonas sp.]